MAQEFVLLAAVSEEALHFENAGEIAGNDERFVDLVEQLKDQLPVFREGQVVLDDVLPGR